MPQYTLGKRPSRHAGGGLCPLGKAVSPSDMVSKTSSSIACTIADCAAGHLPSVLMLALRCSAMSIAPGACCACALNVAHDPNPSGTPESLSTAPPPSPAPPAPPAAPVPLELS